MPPRVCMCTYFVLNLEMWGGGDCCLQAGRAKNAFDLSPAHQRRSFNLAIVTIAKCFLLVFLLM